MSAPRTRSRAATDPPRDGSPRTVERISARSSPADSLNPHHPASDGSRATRGVAVAAERVGSAGRESYNAAGQSRYRTDKLTFQPGAPVAATIGSGAPDWWPEAVADPNNRPESWEPWRERVARTYSRALAELRPSDQQSVLRETTSLLVGLRDTLYLVNTGRVGIEAIQQQQPEAWEAVAESIRNQRARALGRWVELHPQPRNGSGREIAWGAQFLRESNAIPWPGTAGWVDEMQRRLRTLAGADPNGAKCWREGCGGYVVRGEGTWDRWVTLACDRCGLDVMVPPLVWIAGELEKRRQQPGADLEASRLLWSLVSVIERRRKGPRGDLVRRLARYEACGSLWEFSLLYECDGCGYQRTSLFQCGDKECPRCSRIKSATIARRLVAVLTRGGWRVSRKPKGEGWSERIVALRRRADVEPGLRWVRRIEAAPERSVWFATFTVGESILRGKSLGAAIRYTLDAWKRFSRSKAWAAKHDGPAGGFRKVEYVWKPDERGGDGWWHVHVHALVLAPHWTTGRTEIRVRRDGKRFEVERPAEERAIFKAWERAGGGQEPGQKILRVYGESLTAAAIEACKYTSKFESDPKALPAARLGEAMEAMGAFNVEGRKRTRVRMLQGWGEWYGLDPNATCEDCEAWTGEGIGVQCDCGAMLRRPREWEPSAHAHCRCGRTVTLHPEKTCMVCGWLRKLEPACGDCGETSWRVVNAIWWGPGGDSVKDGGHARHDPSDGAGRGRVGRGRGGPDVRGSDLGASHRQIRDHHGPEGQGDAAEALENQRLPVRQTVEATRRRRSAPGVGAGPVPLCGLSPGGAVQRDPLEGHQGRL